MPPKLFTALCLLAAGMIFYFAQYGWNNYRYAPVSGLTADISSDLSFVFGDSYRVGEDISVSVANASSASYTALLPDGGCNFELYDGSGRIILQDYSSDASTYTIVTIFPEAATPICVLKLRECTTRSRTLCRGTSPLGEGMYTVLGKFLARDGSETVIQKEFRVTP